VKTESSTKKHKHLQAVKQFSKKYKHKINMNEKVGQNMEEKYRTSISIWAKKKLTFIF
jgi:hypothetical protein